MSRVLAISNTTATPMDFIRPYSVVQAEKARSAARIAELVAAFRKTNTPNDSIP